MLQRLKKKHIALLALLLLVLLLSYKLAIAKTLAMRNEYLSLKREQQQFENASQQLSLLHKKERALDSVLQSLNLSNTSMENRLLHLVNREAEKHAVKVIDFNPPHSFEANGTAFITFTVVFRGSFTAIVKTLYAIEVQSHFGEIVHINFEKQKNYRTSKNFLEAEVFIQKLE